MHPTLEVTADPKLSLDEAIGLLKSLNALGRSSEPSFGARLQADRESETTPVLARAYFTIASHPKARMQEAVVHAAGTLLGALAQREGKSSIQLGETAVRLSPAVTPEEIASLAGRIAAAVSAGLAAPSPAPGWPDPTQDVESFRSFVHELSSLTVEGIVQTVTIHGEDVYKTSCDQGDLFLYRNGGGWTLALIHQGADSPIRTWSDVPTPQSLVTELILDDLLGAPPPGVQPEFRSIQLDLDTKVERKHFATLDGPVVVHTRQQRADMPVETVVERKAQGLIFTLPPADQLIGDFERRELPELPF